MKKITTHSADQAAADIAALVAENTRWKQRALCLLKLAQRRREQCLELTAENERLKRELAAAREEATYAQNEIEYWRRKYHQLIRQPINAR